MTLQFDKIQSCQIIDVQTTEFPPAYIVFNKMAQLKLSNTAYEGKKKNRFPQQCYYRNEQ